VTIIRLLKDHTSLLLVLRVCAVVAWLVDLSASHVLAGSTEWELAQKPRHWSFPRDHGSHTMYRTEWWYFTGNLRDDEGNRYGYQLTFFRQGVQQRPAPPRNPWDLGDIYLAHFTVTDVKKRRFTIGERISRTGPGLAGARTDGLDVWLLGWSARQREDDILLTAVDSEIELNLTLTPTKPLVMHGEKGLSRKGDKAGQASYYVSYTNLTTTGSLRMFRASASIRVKGISWFDHEFGSNQLAADQAGWDWHSLHFSDGRDLMIYMLRRTDGSVEPSSSGTIIDREGKARHLTLSQIEIEVIGYWKSTRSSALYPSRWRILIPSEKVNITISPMVADQELMTPGSTGVTYWEGAVQGEGASGGQSITTEGYVELTGYAGKLGGIF
jgi:predicted secreted hydrolase